jgi:isochorismate hydrolase
MAIANMPTSTGWPLPKVIKNKLTMRGRGSFRKRGISKVILAGMLANLCVESHLRELLEQGFEVAVVEDATAAAQTPDLDGYAAALVNFRFLANTVWTTAQATAAMEGARNTERSR